ncbi:S41 family peptidase [Parvimonas micra]|uniref:S41 family peptidase n=3 Tax=Parvimonas micra TaxID=33033 RepID=A0AAX3K803_9FIRM|nr:S41 family peptidase [Parvimonas micra]EDP23350.1 peptidase, S41 family [Parvimonas micra ATCC 33270]MEB3060794.1 S41 family peptidase [Parvimonas micra]MEB3066633.1 S41 family peptidase [Parvimonas micra]WBB31329.1 S41 family peptidase [Parvimonas micra]WBB32841.1 S41 family peptidase [Parvimonas micra]
MIKNKKLTCFLVLMIFLCSFISYKAGKNSTAVTGQNTNSGATADYGSFKSFVDAIKEKYYFDIDYEKMNTEIKKAIFSSLGDPYTQYMTEKDMKELQKTSTGKFIGIGVQVSVNENGEVVVVAPIKGGPSQKAGIQAEDIIVKVNDEEVKKNDLESTIKLMRGNEEVGSEVKVTVKRIVDSKEKILDFTVKREEITTESVISKLLDNGTLYVQITNFAEKTGADFEKAVDEGISKGAKSLIIDLRNNPGGLLTSVKQVADKLLPESTIMKIVDSKGKETIEKATGKGIDIPIVVLINKGSASASEVLSVALHDNKKATLVGEKSFGKGIIQSIFPINNGGKTEGIKMTVAEYFGPNGTKIHKVGLEPDYKVEQKNYSKIGIEHLDSDSQLKKAIELLK